MTPSTPNSRGALQTVILMGLLVGTLDITSAFISYYISSGGKNPMAVLRFIATAAFGKEGLPDNAMLVWGLVFHYIIAFSWTILFFIIYPILPFLQKNRIVTGILYGAVIWLFMNLVVLPLSKLPSLPFRPLQASIGMSILIVAIGLPLAFITHRFYKQKG
ncbi:MAG TPA: DUF1440 domain-containing protein [Ohtaekwangia sp.]